MSQIIYTTTPKYLSIIALSLAWIFGVEPCPEAYFMCLQHIGRGRAERCLLQALCVPSQVALNLGHREVPASIQGRLWAQGLDSASSFAPREKLLLKLLCAVLVGVMDGSGKVGTQWSPLCPG